MGCYNCNEEGHFARECPNERGASSRIGGGYGGRGDGPIKPRENYTPTEADLEDLWKDQISSGINFSKYNDIKVKVQGENAPAPMKDFQNSGLATILLENILRAKYSIPTPVQKQGIPIVKEGRDLMACAQTGSGKTVAFLLPIIHKLIETKADPCTGRATQCPQAVIITPTRELAIQIFEEARKFSSGSKVMSAILYGGTNVSDQKARMSRGCNILIATPGRLKDFAERNYISLEQVQFLVLDEADRMLDMGFMPDIRAVVYNREMPKKDQRQTLMFSATFPDEIRRSAGEFLNNYLFLQVGLVGGACTDVKQSFYQCAKFEKMEKFISILNEPDRDQKERTLVFVETKRQADFLCCKLCEEGFPATSIHGDRLQSQREEALNDFRKGKMPILVATAVAARGLDIKGVMHVVNYDMPGEVEEYVHRIGRTGRVGNQGRATSFFDANKDCNLRGALVKVLVDAGQPVPDWLGSAGGRGLASYGARNGW